MAKNYKNTISIFLLITGLIIFSHAILPHDHHYDNHLETTHKEHHEKNKNGQEPVHCHFFNDVVINKITSHSQSIVKPISLFKLYTIDISFNLTEDLVNKNYSNQTFHFPDKLFLSPHSPTRGSPLSFL